MGSIGKIQDAVKFKRCLPDFKFLAPPIFSFNHDIFELDFQKFAHYSFWQEFFACRNHRCLSAIKIQKQMLANFTNTCVWLITNIFMLFLSKFSSWIYWEIITFCSYYKYLSVILENIFHNFPTFLDFMLNMIIVCYFHR